MPRSISWKLGGALLLVVLLSVGLMAYLANLTTGREFTQYLSRGNTAFTQNVAAELGDFYEVEQSWTGVQSILPDFLRGSSGRLVVADSSGKIVGDTESQWLGQSVGGIGLTGGTSVAAGTKQVGSVYILTSTAGSGMGMMGRGYMGGMSGVSGTDMTTMMGSNEEDFLSQINTSLLISGLIAVAVALGLGLILTRMITKPVLSLNQGARQIAGGNLKYRVPVKSRDELGKLADSFNTMADNLEKGEQERRRIIADITHELRTPLTVIDGTVDAIMDGVFQPDKERLGSIKEQTRSLSRLVGDLRDISLMESGQLKLELADTDVVALVRRKLSQMEVKLQEKKIELETDFPSGVPNLMVDSTRIEQVITNLMTNAIRHTPDGGRIRVSVAADRVDRGSGSVVITIADSGEGIAPEHLPHIFDRFYRVEESRSRDVGGAGLGLAIVQQLVRAHGGDVRVESELGRGTAFHVMLKIT